MPLAEDNSRSRATGVLETKKKRRRPDGNPQRTVRTPPVEELSLLPNEKLWTSQDHLLSADKYL
ncbi:hypothetical protein SK128_028231 [Halocaridina rubra]|uniref:Uncharacterized protein n=1 Tax=Halocaridina rubra TaxID=373956 RepID=A0AAN8WXD2_HALRR